MHHWKSKQSDVPVRCLICSCLELFSRQPGIRSRLASSSGQPMAVCSPPLRKSTRNGVCDEQRRHLPASYQENKNSSCFVRLRSCRCVALSGWLVAFNAVVNLALHTAESLIEPIPYRPEPMNASWTVRMSSWHGIGDFLATVVANNREVGCV